MRSRSAGEFELIWGYRHTNNDRPVEFERAFRRLKILMQGIGARIEESRFFTLEMRSRLARRDNDVTAAERFFARLYGVTSDFGLSMLRPIAWIGLLSLLAAAVYMSLIPEGGGAKMAPSVFVVSLQQLLPFFLVAKIDLFGNTGASGWIGSIMIEGGWRAITFSLVAILHSLTNLVLWFLFALALRRKFQIG